MIRATLTLTVLLGVAAWTVAQPPQPTQPAKQKLPENVEKAKIVIDNHLKEIKGESGQVVWLDDKALTDAFPKLTFFAVRYRIYPVAKQLPEGMRPSNVFVVEGDKFKHLKDAKALEEYFRAHLAPIKANAAPEIAKAWLALSQEFVQDGFYKFEVDKNGIGFGENGGNFGVEQRLIVMAGGNGDITAKLTFDKDGKLVSATETVKVKQGPRPICQATKLLDADPIVRKMAEQDLLYMGPAAYDYLMEQRVAAGPELQKAIDRVWAKILKNGW
jgi:hypothetical protein